LAEERKSCLASHEISNNKKIEKVEKEAHHSLPIGIIEAEFVEMMI